MGDFELVRNRLAQTELADLRELAEKIDVPFNTLYNIRRGSVKNPRVKTVEKIASHYKGS